MDQRVTDLYHHFIHGGMNRRESSTGFPSWPAAPRLRRCWYRVCRMITRTRRSRRPMILASPPSGCPTTPQGPQDKSERPSVAVMHENRYNKAAAGIAWSRTLAFFKEKLRASKAV
jgi:hypothetical protein